MANLVYFDVTIGGRSTDRIIFRLFDDVVPKTCKNFRYLCTGEAGIGKTTGKPLTYKGSIFHRIIPGLLVFRLLTHPIMIMILSITIIRWGRLYVPRRRFFC